MALGNFITANTYSTIHHIVYDKHTCMCSFVLRVYQNSTKQNVLTEIGYSLDGSYLTPEVLDKLSTSPISPSDGDRYLVEAGATGDWAGQDYYQAVWNAGTSSWDFQVADSIYYNSGDSKYYQCSIYNSELYEVTDYFDKRKWDTWMLVSVIGGNDAGTDQNIVRRLYQYLKTRIEFTGVIDV